MNIITVTAIIGAVLGTAYGVPNIRGDSGIGGIRGFPNDGLPLNGALGGLGSGNHIGRPMPQFLDIGSIGNNRQPLCYDGKVIADQYFDDSFICYDNMTYPTEEIMYAMQMPENRQFRNYMFMAGRCFDESNYYMEHKAVQDYSFNCVCKSNRKLISAVYHGDQKCHIVDNQKQKIYHATCGGVCKLSYGYMEGYFCVNQGWTTRQFLVYCEHANKGLSHWNPNADFGSFYFMTKNLPTYCGCRGYFGCGMRAV